MSLMLLSKINYYKNKLMFILIIDDIRLHSIFRCGCLQIRIVKGICVESL